MDRLEELRQRFTNEPLGIFFGATLDALERGCAVVSAKARSEFLIVDGIVQGGITTVIADFAAVYAAMSKIPTGHTRAENINTYFLRPIKEGDLIIAEAGILNESRSHIWANVVVYAGQDMLNLKLSALATALFAKPKQ